MSFRREPKADRGASCAAVVRDGSRDDPTPMPILTKKCDIFFCHDKIPLGMNLHSGSLMGQTLIFSIPREDINRLDVIDFVFENFGPVDGIRHHRNACGSKLEIFFGSPETYQTVCQQGIDFQGHHLEPVVPDPPSLRAWKISYRDVPPDFKIEDYRKVFGAYGEILEIGRYYWQINNYRVFSGDGFIFFEQSQRKYAPLSEFIDWEVGRIHTKIIIAPVEVPATTSVQRTNQPTISQPQPLTGAPAKTNVKKKRNSKKRLNNNNDNREHSYPADSKSM